MKTPPIAWVSGAFVTALLLIFAYPVRVPNYPIPKVALERLDFVPIWRADIPWTSPGWFLGEIVVGMAVAVIVTRVMAARPKKVA